ncbi:MAG: rod shape-determining protein MreC, partial [Gammaproteobacteria bacterium]|nr:rod shape-determining protein MreC [Gammaproteobacteria bacterium]
ARLQRLDAVEAENERLRQLLSASSKIAQKVLLAELVEVSLEPFTHKVVLNRGQSDGAYVGQPVIDPNGVVGQVTQATPFTSAVTLITDPGHAIPVQVLRNDLRAIVFGTGVRNQLGVPYLARHADIVEGDVLVTSGMGGRFPSGYPVARVATILRDPNEPFLKITAIPVARLDHAKEVLLIWQDVGVPLSDSGSDSFPRIQEGQIGR